MKILAFSDVHCDLGVCAALVAAAEAADLVIGAGDFARVHRGLAECMAALEPIEPTHAGTMPPGGRLAVSPRCAQAGSISPEPATAVTSCAGVPW